MIGPGSESIWSPGETILLQEVWEGRVWTARPVTFVHEREGRLMLWCPAGTMFKAPRTPASREPAATRAERFVSNLTHKDWSFIDFAWPVSNLILVRPEDHHAVWVGWDAEGNDFGWYVNFQQPLVRTPKGVQTMDLMLDIVVANDLSWKWKDRDELDALVQAGLIDPAEEKAVNDEAALVIPRIEGHIDPFVEEWHAWRPDPGWPLPELAAGWDEM